MQQAEIQRPKQAIKVSLWKCDNQRQAEQLPELLIPDKSVGGAACQQLQLRECYPLKPHLLRHGLNGREVLA